MKKISFTLIVLFLLLACSTTQKYDNKLNALIGADKEKVIATFGKPSAVKILSDNTEVLSYNKAQDVYVPSEFYLYNQGEIYNGYDTIYSPFLSDYDFSPYGDTFGYDVEYFCQTVFLLQNNKVIAWRWRGNDCLSN